MKAVGWPLYEDLKHRPEQSSYLRVLLQPDVLRPTLGYIVACAIYAFGLWLPVPWVRVEPLPDSAWKQMGWQFYLISDLLTGGALQRGSLLAIGVPAYVLYQLCRTFIWREKSPSVLFTFGLIVGVAILTAWVYTIQGRFAATPLRFGLLVVILVLGASVVFMFAPRFTDSLRGIDFLLLHSLLLIVMRFAPAAWGFMVAANWWQIALFFFLPVFTVLFLVVGAQQRARLSAICVKNRASFRRSELRMGTAHRTVLLSVCVSSACLYIAMGVVWQLVSGPLVGFHALVLSGALLLSLLVLGARLLRLITGWHPLSLALKLQEEFWVVPKESAPGREAQQMAPGDRMESTPIYRVGVDTAEHLERLMMRQWRRTLILFLLGISGLFAFNALVIYYSPEPSLFFLYGPLIQLWIMVNIVEAGAHLFRDVKAMQHIQSRQFLQKNRPTTATEVIQQEIEQLVLPTQHHGLEIQSRGLLSTDPDERQDAYEALLDELRVGRNHVRRVMVAMGLTLCLTCGLLFVLPQIGWVVSSYIPVMLLPPLFFAVVFVALYFLFSKR